MWIRSRLSLLFFILIVLYAAASMGFLTMLQRYERLRTAVYFLNQARFTVQEMQEDWGPRSADWARKTARRIDFIANTGHGLDRETREQLNLLARHISQGDGTSLQKEAMGLLNSITAKLTDKDRRLSVYLLTWPMMLVLFLSAMVLLTLGALYAVNQSILHPIESLVRASKEIGAGKFDTRVEPERADEIGMLAIAIEQMRENLVRLIDELNRSHRALKEREKMAALGEMCAAVAHSIKNPLAAIRSSAQLAARGVEDGTIKDIVSEVDVLNERLNVLLQAVHPMSGEGERVELADIVRSVILTMERLFGSRGLTFTTRIEPNLTMLIHRSMLELILTTIVENSCQASEPGGKIEIESFRCNGSIAIVVSDTGRGIDETAMQRLFQPFESSKPDGAGLGLSLVRKVVEAYGGQIVARSRVGKGTTMRVQFPEWRENVPRSDR